MSRFAEAADLIEKLPALVRERRQALGVSLREAAEWTGVSFNTLSRIERGGSASAENVVRLLRWLDQDVTPMPAAQFDALASSLGTPDEAPRLARLTRRDPRQRRGSRPPGP